MAFVAGGFSVWAIGFAANSASGCKGLCETVSFALMFAGLPFSGSFTVLGGTDLVVAWPLDVITWVVLGALPARTVCPTTARRRTALIVATALLYGLVLASMVQRA